MVVKFILVLGGCFCLVCLIVFVFFPSRSYLAGCALDAMVVGSGDFSRLLRKLGIKVGARSPHTVEEVALAMREVISHRSIKSLA